MGSGYKVKKIVKVPQEAKLRNRAFKQVIKEAYDFKCAVCGMKIYSPNTLLWEAEAAHIVPHSANGKDDILNGLALCRLHHWAFDVGWFTLEDNFKIIVSRKIKDLSADFGKLGNYDFMREFRADSASCSLNRQRIVRILYLNNRQHIVRFSEERTPRLAV
jgi:putative restriction endonuclease